MLKEGYYLFEENMESFNSIEFLNVAKGNNEASFIRKRKMTACDVAEYIVGSTKERNQQLKCIKYNFVRSNTMNISNQGINLQRLKLNPEAIKYVSSDLVRLTYGRHNYERTLQAKGYYLLAIDGSDVVLPNMDETYNSFRGPISKNNVRATMGTISTAYDVINRIIVDGEIYPYKTSEQLMGIDNVKAAMRLINDDPKIFIFDRGYVSIPMLLEMFKLNQNFIFRVPNRKYIEEIKAMVTNDELISIEMTKERLFAFKNAPTYNEILCIKHIVVRCVKFTLSTGEEEILFTNLESDKFSINELKEIYNMRWGIESVYNALKHKIDLEKFSGYKPTIIKQDFYASLYLWNIMQNMILDERKEISDELPNHIYEMKINDSIALELIKTDLLKIFYSEKKRDLFFELADKIRKYIEPIRPDRHFKRPLKVNRNNEHYKELRKPLDKKYRDTKKANNHQ